MIDWQHGSVVLVEAAVLNGNIPDRAQSQGAVERASRAVRLIQKDQLEMSDELQQHLAALKVHKIGAVRRDIGNLHGPGDFDG